MPVAYRYSWKGSKGRWLQQSELLGNESHGTPVLIRMWVLIKQKMSDLALGFFNV